MKTFDFSEALAFLKNGMPVAVQIEGIERRYYLDNGVITCEAKNTTYVVNKFYTDAILSEKWYLIEE